MFNKELMSPRDLEIYEKAIEALKAIKKEHKRLMGKLKNKTITEDENKQLRELIKAHNKIEKLKQTVWENNSLIKIAMKQEKK